MNFFKRMFGLESWQERMMREFGTPAADRTLARKEAASESAIQAALNALDVQEVMRDTGLTEVHLRDLHRRLMLGGDARMAARALRRVSLLRWYANNGGMDMKQTQAQFHGLLVYATTGKPPIENV